MITIHHKEGCITIEGHAGYAPAGQDIVCAAVSALLQVLVLSIEKLTHDDINADLNPGKSLIQYGELSKDGELLVNAFFVGIEAIANSYPDNVLYCKIS